ncbi:MAG: carboxypeptidase regulatory-like domain-containing protein [Lachnospiraceae bacterium]
MKKNKKFIAIVGAVLAVCIIAVVLVATSLTDNFARMRMSGRLDLAEEYLDDMDYENAIATYEEIIEIEPKLPDAYLGLADVYVEMGDYESAIAVLEDGIDAVKNAEDLEDYLEEVEDLYDEQSKAEVYGTVTIADTDMDFSNNMALEDAKVELARELEYDGVRRRATTDENGEYTFKHVVPGTYILKVSRRGYADIEQEIVVLEDQEVYYNAVLEVIGDEYRGKGTASGTICDAATGYGVEDLTLNIRPGWNNTDGRPVEVLTTDEYGYYCTEEMDYGNYTVEIVDERQVEEPYLSSSFNIKIMGDVYISNQDGAVSMPMKDGQVRIVLTWGEYPSDLDSHMWFEGAGGNEESYHVYYSSPSAYKNDEIVCDLDLDDTSSYGPETTTIYVPENGFYHFGIYNYSHGYESELSVSGATVQVYTENTGVPTYTFYVPGEDGYYWDVFTYDSRTRVLTPVNQIIEDYSDRYDSYEYDGYY